ncbi:MAG: helix-turn-helix domain-containing protein [Methylococcaceae bacterium]
MLTVYPSYTRLFMWRNRLLYFGLSQQLNAHTYAAVALHIGLYEPFLIKIANGNWQTCRCVLIPVGIKHALNFGRGIHAKIFIERDSVDFLYCQRRFNYATRQITLFYDESLIAQLKWIYETNPSKVIIEQYLDKILGCDGSLKMQLDKRVQRAIHLICDTPDNHFSYQYLAEINSLSPSRFLHLFKQHTNMSYRRFRAWRRLFLAVERLNSADNMTFAAVDAGFADAPHFSHSFKEAFGINPAFVFRGIDRFEVK